MLEAEALSKKCCSPSQFVIDQGGNCCTDQCVAWDWDYWSQETEELVELGGLFSMDKYATIKYPREEWTGDCRLLRKR